MKRYEALIILHNPTQEDGIKLAIDQITEDINAAGGRVDTVQKMDRKPFSRVTDRKVTSGFYVNVIFDVPGTALKALQAKILARDEVYRVTLTLKPKTELAEAAEPVAAV